MLRRRFVQIAAGSSAAAGLLGGAAAVGGAGEPANRLEQFGVQLSTLTRLLLADFEGTLAKVAEIGYSQVEFGAMGMLGRPLAEVQRLLDEHGLTAPVGRVSPRLPDGLLGRPMEEIGRVFMERSSAEHLLDNVRAAIDGAQVFGQKILNLPGLPPNSFQSLAQVRSSIELLRQAGQLCAEHGILFGYHNHGWELQPVDGVIPYDLMIEETDPDRVCFQLDTYWMVKAGGDLVDYLTRFAGRFPTCHLKDIDAAGDFADVGHGEIDFPAFTRAVLAQGCDYFFVERDNPPNPMQAIRNSYDYLSGMTF